MCTKRQKKNLEFRMLFKMPISCQIQKMDLVTVSQWMRIIVSRHTKHCEVSKIACFRPHPLSCLALSMSSITLVQSLGALSFKRTCFVNATQNQMGILWTVLDFKFLFWSLLSNGQNMFWECWFLLGKAVNSLGRKIKN